MNFLQPNSEIKLSEFASNVLRLVNNTNRPQEVKLMVNPPAGWRMLGKSVKKYQLAVNDSLIVPVRLQPAGNLQGDMTYITNVFLTSQGYTIANATWNIEIKKRSDWSANLSSNQVYFSQNTDSTTCTLNLFNSGNADEALIVNALTEPGVLIQNQRGDLVKEIRLPLLLRVNQDTSLTFNVARIEEDVLPTQQDEEEVKRYRIKVKVLNERQKHLSKGTWTGNINFLKLSDSRQVEESVLPSFPLTVEWNSFNILEDNTYGSLGLYGYKKLSNSRYFSYYYQASFVQNQIDFGALQGDYFYLGYFTPHYNVEVGDITAGKIGSLLVGSGIKGSYTYKNHQVGAIYIGNPSPFEDPFLTGYGAFYTYKKNKLKADVYYESTNNTVHDIQSNYATVDANYRVNQSHTIQLGGGYSIENYTGAGVEGVTGYRAKLGYWGLVKKFTINFNGLYHSESYAPRRGVINSSATVAYPITERIRLRGGGSFFENAPSDVLYDGSIRDTISTSRTNYFVQMLQTVNGQSFVLQPQYIMYKSNALNTNTAGASFEYRTRLNKQTSFFSTVFAGQASFPTYSDIDPIFVSNIRLSLRYKHFNANVRYYYGPFYLNEQIIYVNTLENPQRLFAMVNHDYWFARNKMQLNLNMNYNYRTIQGRHQLVARPELFYHSKSRFRFSVYANYLLYANAQYERSSTTVNYSPIQSTDFLVPASTSNRIEFGFGIKFNVNVPAGVDRNYRATMLVFRDLNGNGIKDRGEEGYENMLIRVTPVSENFTEDDILFQQEIYELITNYKGEVEYRHLPKGNYKIETIPLVATEGWYGGQEFYKYIDGNQVINIPLSRGARLSGGIFVQRDVHSDDKAIVLGGIRVTAVNQLTGESLSSLTDQYGNYSMYLPNGDYIITINEGAVGSRYQFLENNIPLSVKNSGENYNVGFFLVEKQRTINFGTKRGSNAIMRSAGIRDNRSGSQGEDAGLIRISPPEAIGKGQVVQLFGAERERLKLDELDTLQSVADVMCIETISGKYLYVTNGVTKKGTVKKLLKKIKTLGYAEAAIVKVDDLPIAKEEEQDAAPVETGEKPVNSSKRFETISTEADKTLFRVQFESTAILYEPSDFEESLPGIDVIYTIQTGDVIYYSVGAFQTEKEAKKYLKSFKKKYNTIEAVIRQYVDEE
ncbi:hypothetical protein J1N10_09555 [Carboxylicivirga sp. A043]|uniref:carboxypeptidase-like regulatory domain-containing protein n=1 Tax=Carboxylicivirga litoralis TaxID=2816963 RepID=UPI0021CB756E|nr:carboxypeptidase-like regulatory domain-containing protein [Carboxylicivirga sp. A043]MCU4156222.1 hypothetical protein [Carboxylicivirga sp. A043]